MFNSNLILFSQQYKDLERPKCRYCNELKKEKDAWYEKYGQIETLEPTDEEAKLKQKEIVELILISKEEGKFFLLTICFTLLPDFSTPVFRLAPEILLFII